MRPHNWVFQLLTQIAGPFRVVVCLLACWLLLFTCQILEAHLELNSLKAVSLFLHTNRRAPKFAFPPTVEKLLFPFVGKDRDQQPWGPKLKLHWRETGSRFPRDTEFVFPGQDSTKSGLSRFPGECGFCTVGFFGWTRWMVLKRFPHWFITGQDRGSTVALSLRKLLLQSVPLPLQNLLNFAHQQERENVFFTSL